MALEYWVQWVEPWKILVLRMIFDLKLYDKKIDLYLSISYGYTIDILFD
jgi:hypothetical protein